jgi:hypothetical protein
VANQDTDNLAIFNFNQSSGEIKFTGNEYRVPSPNFVCCCKIHDENDENQRSSFSGNASDISEPVSEEDASSFAINTQKKLEDDLARAVAEVERLKATIATFSK